MKHVFVVPELGTDKPGFAPKLGRCLYCGVLACLPEPHLEQCPERTEPTKPFIRYNINDQPFSHQTNGN